MRSGRPKVYQVTLNEEQREQLLAFSRSRSLPHGLSRRAAVILHAGEGMPNKTIAKRVGMTETTVRKWCKRFIDEGIDGLHYSPGDAESLAAAIISGLSDPENLQKLADQNLKAAAGFPFSKVIQFHVDQIEVPRKSEPETHMLPE